MCTSLAIDDGGPQDRNSTNNNNHNNNKYQQQQQQLFDWCVLLMFVWSKSKVVTNLRFKYLLSNPNIFDVFFSRLSNPIPLLVLKSMEWNLQREGSKRWKKRRQTQSFNINRKSLHQLINTLKRKSDLINDSPDENVNLSVLFFVSRLLFSCCLCSTIDCLKLVRWSFFSLDKITVYLA